MTQSEFEAKLNSLQEKIGEDASALVLDDLALLINDNKQMNEAISNKETKIQELESKNEKLQLVNGNLLQQVSMGIDPELEKTRENDTAPTINLRDCFDDRGNFKR